MVISKFDDFGTDGKLRLSAFHRFKNQRLRTSPSKVTAILKFTKIHKIYQKSSKSIKSMKMCLQLLRDNCMVKSTKMFMGRRPSWDAVCSAWVMSQKRISSPINRARRYLSICEEIGSWGHHHLDIWSTSRRELDRSVVESSEMDITRSTYG